MTTTPEPMDPLPIFDRIAEAYVALDLDWRYTYLNAKAGELLGRRPQELIGKHIWTEFPEGVDQPFHRPMSRPWPPSSRSRWRLTTPRTAAGSRTGSFLRRMD